ncbi:MAG: outer membrane beta-barrel protein, partial [Runella zeae]
RDKIVQRINPRVNDALQTNPFENLGKNKSIGFEADFHYSFDNNLRVDLNMSKFNSVFNVRYDPNGREYDYYNRQLPNEPFWTTNANVQYTIKDLWKEKSALNLYYGFRFVERFYTTWLLIDDFRTPRQYIQDLGISYAFPQNKFVISADAKNIFDQQVYDNFAVQKPGRAFYLKLNYLINNF